MFGARPSEWLHVDGGVAHSTVGYRSALGLPHQLSDLRLPAIIKRGGCPELSLENILEQSIVEAAMKAPLIA